MKNDLFKFKRVNTIFILFFIHFFLEIFRFQECAIFISMSSVNSSIENHVFMKYSHKVHFGVSMFLCLFFFFLEIPNWKWIFEILDQIFGIYLQCGQ